jgi:cysteine desulfurase
MSLAFTRSRPGVYLDAAASMAVRPEAKAAVLRALELGANPSSVHAAGRRARDLIETARRQVADLAGGSAERLLFTSGATEANALALGSAAGQVARLIVSATEHDAVMENAPRAGLPVEIWPVDQTGLADLDWLEASLRRPGRALVALMAANNETGVLQPVAEAARLVRAADGLLHVDAAQAAGKIAFDMKALGADSVTVSGHKLGAPQGVGALLYSERFRPKALWAGGGQELALRSGTENVPGIAGFGAAAEASLAGLEAFAGQAALRDAVEARLVALGVVAVAKGAPRLPNIAALAYAGFEQARQVMALDLEGVQVSAGAACSSGKVRRSRVLDAMELQSLSPFVIRVSSGWETTAEDWARFAEAYEKALARRTTRAGAEV